MKKFLFVLFLISPLFVWAQFPANPVKQRLGYQTTALGLTYYSDTIPLHTPTSYLNDAEVVVDTINDVTWTWTSYSWRANGVLRQSSPPLPTKTAASNTLDHRYSTWWRDADSTYFSFNFKSTCWEPITVYRGDTIPDDIAAGAANGAVCFTQGLWYETDVDTLRAYTGGQWIAIGSGGGGTDDQTATEVLITDAGAYYINGDVEGALQEAGFDISALATLSGRPLASTDLGTGFTGTIIPDNTTVTGALQALETAVEAGSGGGGVSFNYVEYKASIDSTTMSSLFSDSLYTYIHVVEKDTATQDLVVYLPSAKEYSGREIRIGATLEKEAFHVYLEPMEGYLLFGDQRPYRYYLDNGEAIILNSDGSNWRLSTNYQIPYDWGATRYLLPNIEMDGFSIRSLPTTANDSADGHVVRSFLSKAPGGENLIKRSSDISQFPFWNNSSGQVTIQPGVGIAPNGTQTVSRVVYNSGNGNLGYLPNNGGAGGSAFNLWDENTTYTLSIWASVEPGDSSSIFPIVNNTDLSATAQPITHTDLRRYSWTFTTDPGISPTRSFNLRIGAQDSINLWQLQVERGVAASPDIITGLDTRAFRDSVFVQQMPVAGFLEYSKARRILSGFEAHEIVTKLMDHHQENPNTKGVFIDEEITLTQGITVPQNTVFKGLKDKISIRLDLNDTTAYGITVGDQTATYNTGISLRDLRIEAVSGAKAAIYALTSLEEEWLNIAIVSEESDQNLLYGIYEPLFNFRSIQREISNLYISGARTGWFTTCQSTSRLENVSMRRDLNKGVECYGCGFSADNLLFEQIAGPAISAYNAKRIDLNKVRIEDVPNTNENEDPTFLISGAEQITILNSELGPVHSFNAGNEVLRLDSVTLAIVKASSMETIGDGCPVSTTGNTETLVWKYNTGVAQTLCDSEIDNATQLYVFRDENNETFIPNQVIEDTQSDKLYTDSTSIDGKTFVLTDTVDLIGPHNLLRRSDNINQFPYWSNNSNSVDFTNNQTGPDGGTDATKIVYSGGSSSFSFIPTSGTDYDVWEPLTWYNLSFKGQLYNVADTAYIYPVVNETVAEYDTAFITSTSFERHNFAFRTTTDVSPTASINFYVASQDSFLFAHPQLSKGQYVKDYVETTSTAEVKATGTVFSGGLSLDDGVFNAPLFTAAEASTLSASDGDFVYITTTNGTFTSVGFWGYENGAWVKL